MSLLREENFGIEYHMPFFGESMPPGLSRGPDETHKKKKGNGRNHLETQLRIMLDFWTQFDPLF